ncbi:MAG: neutral/alkaline non-lysosomal ceramidase N-terminal domain-containing protein [Planctomycetota bacterium]
MNRLLAVLTILCVLTGTHFVYAAEQWRAGVAKANITPDEFMLMAGYGARTEPALGKLTDLWAKALVLEDATGQQGVVITLDLVGVDRLLANKVCESLKTEYGLGRKQIAICTSHTHTGPVVGMNLGPLHYLVASKAHQNQIEAYAAQLHAKIVGIVGDAIAAMQPAKLHWGSGHCDLAVNRRENKPYDKVPEWRTAGELKGPVDYDVPVLSVRDNSGSLLSVLFGYACHATVLGDRQWSGDYPGFAQIELEERHPGCVAMFWAGCGADQNPLPRKTAELARHYGRRLANAVESVILTSTMTPVSSELLMEYQEIDLPLADLPSKQQLGEDASSADRFVAARAKVLLEEMDRAPLKETYPYPVSCWRIGNDIKFVLLGGEVVVDYAVRLKTELDGTRTWVAGYANDVMAYIPSRRVLLEGGYEGGGAMVYYGLPTVWSPKIEENIVNEVLRQSVKLDRQTPLDIGSRLELFVDDFLVDSTQGDVTKALMKPEPREVVLVADQPWEGNTSGYFTLFRDGDLYRMIYRGWQHDKNKKAAHPEVTCYAESRDGIHWKRPNLGFFEWDGSKENNIVWLGQGTHNFTAFRDDNPNADPAFQFKAFGGSGGQGGLSRGLLPLGSADCKSWKLLKDKPVITHGAFDSQNLAFWDTDRKEYRAYWRYFVDGVRAIRTATSKDFLKWENEADLTYGETTPTEDLYTNAIQKYFRAPHLFIGFPTRFEPKSQQVEPVLMTSRDGVHFNRWSDPVVPRTAPQDRNHNRSNYMTWGMFQLPGKPEEISVYATENYYEETPGRLRRFVYRTDGFVALRANQQGAMTTRPLKYNGGNLRLNYKTRDTGTLVVEVLDQSGKVVGVSKKMSGDSIDELVQWESPFSKQTTVLRLRFQMEDVDLFSLQFSTEASPE